ncbi:MAG: hypothetical protein HC796_04725 [Synechococcaceae cyanobacterium RL_1_2]|nr:hypothetical protein [Synechococcaceae cyanobacterium RL_1_2]
MGGLVIIAIASIRLFHLDLKPYWNDEVYTLLRLSGATKLEIYQSLGPRIHHLGELAHYQWLQQSTGFQELVNGLILDDVHPPLYFALAWLTVKTFPGSDLTLRWLSVVLSIALIPMVYGLSQELWRSRAVSYVATLLFTASPIFTLYAQEARPYPLLCLLNVGSSWLLLSLIKHPRKGGWFAYAGLSTLGLYCHTLYYLTLASQCVFIQALNFYHLITPERRIRRQQLIAIGAAIGGFVPWLIYVLWVQQTQGQGLSIILGANYTWNPFPMGLVLEKLWLSLTTTIYDFVHPYKTVVLSAIDFNPELFGNLPPLAWGHWSTMAIITIGIIVAIAYTLKSSPLTPALFLVSLALPFCVFMAKDFLIEGYATSIIRYHLPTVLIIYLSLAYGIGQWSQSTVPWQKFMAIAIAMVIIQTEVWSTVVSVQTPTWWNRAEDYTLPAVFTAIKQIPNPMLLVDDDPRLMVRLLILGHHLNLPFQLINPEKLNEAIAQGQNQGYENFLFFKASSGMKAQLSQVSMGQLTAIEVQQDCFHLDLRL